jgi:PPP family 3-phenylpropionic acid transporter
LESPPKSISLVWLFALGGLGLFFPFFSMYLDENVGLTGSEIGGVMAMIPAIGIFAQPLWGVVADRSGLRARMLAVLCLGAGACYMLLFAADGFGAILAGTALLALFAAAIVPSAVAVTLALTAGGGPHGFGRVRVWGTIGFLLLVATFPRALRLLGFEDGAFGSAAGASEPGLGLLLPITGALTIAAGLAALRLPRTTALSLQAAEGDWLTLLRHPPYIRVLAFAMLGYFFLQGPMGMFALYVRAHGGSAESVSAMWILMLLVEIPLIALSGQTLARVGARGLLAIGVLAGGVRWIVCGFTSDLQWVYLVSLLHGVTVTGLVIGAPLYVEAVVPERLRATGQGILAMVGVSIGGISSNLGTGWLIEHVGPDAPYVVGGFGALALVALLPLLLPHPHELEPESPEAGA